MSEDNPRKMTAPDRTDAEEAVRTLLRWAGDDPEREGLLDTPARVARAFEEWFAGYQEEPMEFLERTFEEVEGYDEMVVLRDIRLESYCEHHLAPSVPFHHLAGLHRKVGHQMNSVDKGYIAVQWEVLTKHLSGIVRPRSRAARAVQPTVK